MKKLFYSIVLLIFISCQGKNNIETENTSNIESKPITEETNTGSNEWSDKYYRIDAKDIPENAMRLIGEDWMLVTSGNKDSFNSMTASWGTLGYLWEKNISMITVRDIRYTYQFLETNDAYTLSFFTEEFRGALNIMGSKSGRDSNKVKEAGLTPIATPLGNMSYQEARMILECKKLYAESIKEESIKDKSIVQDFYNGSEKAKHTLYIGEIVNVWIKK